VTLLNLLTRLRPIKSPSSTLIVSTIQLHCSNNRVQQASISAESKRVANMPHYNYNLCSVHEVLSDSHGSAQTLPTNHNAHGRLESRTDYPRSELPSPNNNSMPTSLSSAPSHRSTGWRRHTCSTYHSDRTTQVA
jgi:hypothetical protein